MTQAGEYCPINKHKSGSILKVWNTNTNSGLLVSIAILLAVTGISLRRTVLGVSRLYIYKDVLECRKATIDI